MTATNAAVATAALETRGLSKTFGHGDLAVTAVRAVDLTVAPGEVVLIDGPSGSGKTTLLLMLGALREPTAGSVIVDGDDIWALPERRGPSSGPATSDSCSRTSTFSAPCPPPRTSPSPASPAATPASWPPPPSNESASATAPISVPTNSPAARNNASPSPAPSSTTPPSSSPTNPPPTSTPPTAAKSPASYARSPTTTTAP